MGRTLVERLGVVQFVEHMHIELKHEHIETGGRVAEKLVDREVR